MILPLCDIDDPVLSKTLIEAQLIIVENRKLCFSLGKGKSAFFASLKNWLAF